jgi:hypothetical protein
MFTGINRPELEANHSPTFSDEHILEVFKKRRITVGSS